MPPEETLGDVMRQLGIYDASAQTRSPLQTAIRSPRNRPPPRQMRSAEQRAMDPNAGVRRQAMGEIQRRSAADLATMPRTPRGNQFAEAGAMALEATGLPQVRRGAETLGDVAQAPYQPNAPMRTLGGAGELGLGVLGAATFGEVGAMRPRVAPPPRPLPYNYPPSTRVYHGTAANADFAVPSLERTRRGDGISVTPDPRQAAEYSGSRREGARILPLNLNGDVAGPAQWQEAVRAGGERWKEYLRERGYVAYRAFADDHPVVIDEGGLTNALTGEAGVPGVRETLGEQAFRRRMQPPEPMPRMTPPPRGASVQSEIRSDGAIELARLSTPFAQRGQGQARQAMNDLIRNADGEGRDIWLRAEPLDKTTDAERLRGFYRGLGFEDAGADGRMVRRASDPSPPLTRPPTQIAPNGMPIRPPQPFRNSLRGGNDDLAEAATMRAPQGGEALNWLGNDRLIRNPTEADLARLAELGDEMKYVMDTDGNVYAFSAADAHHNNAMRALRDNGVTVRPLGPGAEITDPDAAGFIWRNKDGSFTHENANMVESGPYSGFAERVRPKPSAGKFFGRRK